MSRYLYIRYRRYQSPGSHYSRFALFGAWWCCILYFWWSTSFSLLTSCYNLIHKHSICFVRVEKSHYHIPALVPLYVGLACHDDSLTSNLYLKFSIITNYTDEPTDLLFLCKLCDWAYDSKSAVVRIDTLISCPYNFSLESCGWIIAVVLFLFSSLSDCVHTTMKNKLKTSLWGR